MRQNRFLVALSVFASVAICIIAILISFYKTPKPLGVWEDKEGEFYITFLEDGTYIDSVFQSPFNYYIDGSTLILHDATGQTTSTLLHKNFGGEITIILNGVKRVLTPVDEVPEVSPPDILNLQTISSFESRTSGYGEDIYLRLREGNYYTFTIGSEQISGPYAKATNNDLYLYDTVSKTVDCAKAVIGGYAFSPLTAELLYSVQKSNALEIGALELSGTAGSTESGVYYQFHDDNVVFVGTSDTDLTEMTYFCDSDGLIAITDLYGVSYTDYLYYDISSGLLYRNLMVEDSWYSYLKGLSEDSVVEGETESE